MNEVGDFYGNWSENYGKKAMILKKKRQKKVSTMI